MNVGYWTRQSEEWYVHRRDKLDKAAREGRIADLDLRNASVWRQGLRAEVSSQRVFLTNFSRASAKLLD